MSTKSTIKYYDGTNCGYHLFTDLYDEDIGVVHLSLTGVQFEAMSNGSVTVAIPVEWAKRLGLIATSKE